jgi:hypothetical protein
VAFYNQIPQNIKDANLFKQAHFCGMNIQAIDLLTGIGLLLKKVAIVLVYT